MNEEKEHKLVHFRPLFYGFIAMLFALLTTRFVFSGKIVYIVLDFVVVFGTTIFLLVKKKVVPIIVIVCFFAFGMGWYFVGLATFEGREYGSSVQITGRVSDDLTTDNGRGVVTLKGVRIDGKREKNIRLYYNVESGTLAIGDLVKFNGQVKKVKAFELGSFNSTCYRKRIAYTTALKESEIAITGTKSVFAERVRMKAKRLLFDSMGKENGAVAYAVLFGDKNEIDGEVASTYKTAGIVHILTISGLHISFLIALLGFVLKKCKVKGWINFLINLVFVGFYSYLCGFTPAVLRAGIMGLVLVYAQMFGKFYDRLNALGFAGLLILCASPLSAHDVGFLMSFGSVFGIFAIMPQLSRLFAKIMNRYFADGLAITISAQIGILPFVSAISGKINFLSVFTNLIVVPIFSVLYPLLFVSMLFCLIMPFLKFMLTFCGWGFGLVYEIAKLMSVSALTINLKPISIYVSVAFFVLLFAISKFFMAKRKIKLVCCGVMIAISSALFGLNLTNLPAQASVAVCYNGYIPTILLTNNSKKSVIIDTSEGAFTNGVLMANNVAKVSALVCLNYQKINTKNIYNTNIPLCIKTDSEACTEDDVCQSVDTQYQLDGFMYKYVSHYGKLIGVEVQFDNTKVFVAKNNATSTDIEDVATQKYNFVVVGTNYKIAKDFTKAGSVIGYYQNEHTNCSYLKDGNFAYRIYGNKYIWGCLD